MWVDPACRVDQEVASTADKWLTKTVSCRRGDFHAATRGTQYVHVYVLIDDLIAAGAIVIRHGRGLIRRAATPNCPPSR